MSNRRRKQLNVGLALVAAYMLVLQALIGAFALGSAAASPMLDAFGNPLCITSMHSTDNGSGGSDHGTMPDCCTASCSMFAPATADERTLSSVANPLPVVTARPAPGFDTVAHTHAPEENPGSPRAPPATAA